MKYFWQICCTCLISLLFYFFSSLRRGDQSTVFCIVSSDFNWSRSPKIGHHFVLVCRCFLADIRRFFTKAPSTPAEEIWKRRFHSENASYVFGSHLEGEIWKRTFYSESASNVFRSHWAKGTWKRRFHSKNASNVFRRLHYAGGIENRINYRSCFWGKSRKSYDRLNLKSTPAYSNFSCAISMGPKFGMTYSFDLRLWFFWFVK